MVSSDTSNAMPLSRAASVVTRDVVIDPKAVPVLSLLVTCHYFHSRSDKATSDNVQVCFSISLCKAKISICPLGLPEVSPSHSGARRVDDGCPMKGITVGVLFPP